jgi:hypothetical protein
MSHVKENTGKSLRKRGAVINKAINDLANGTGCPSAADFNDRYRLGGYSSNKLVPAHPEDAGPPLFERRSRALLPGQPRSAFMAFDDPRKDGSYIALQLDALSWAQTAANLGVPLDGSMPFTVDAWGRFNGLPAQTQLLAQPGVFSFGSVGESVAFGFAGGPTVLSDPNASALEDDTWHYVCASFDGAQVRLYIDGQFNVQQGLAPATQPSPVPILLGPGFQGLLRCVRLYNRALPAETIASNMFGTPDPATIAACFDFSKLPPVDTGPSQYPIALKSNAQMLGVSPAVTLAATGYAQPIRDESINPGGAQVDPYTVQSWIYLNSTSNHRQAIFVNSDLESDSGMALLLEWDDTTKGFKLVAQRGSLDASRLVSQADVPMNSWVNVATTFDGTTASVYINGQPSGPVAAPPITIYRQQSSLLIGAALSQGIPTGATSLQGYIRGVDVWRRALSAAEIITYMINAPAADDPDVAAVYQFTSKPARNAVNGHPIGLADGAVLSGQLGPASASEPEHVAHAPFEALDAGTVAKLASEVNFAELFKEHGRVFRAARDTEVKSAPKRVRAHVEKAWDTMLAGMANGIAPAFSVTDHLLGDERIFIAHLRDGPRVVYRAPAAQTPECVAWQVRLVFIIVGGLLMAIAGVNSNLTNQAVAYITRILQRPQVAAKLALGTFVTARALLEFFGVLYDAGVLRQLLMMIVDLGVWALLRMIARMVLIACGVGWVDVIASLAATVGAFIVAYVQRPASCDPIPQVSLAAIKFNWDPSTATADALTIRKNFATAIVPPEWVPSDTSPQDAPAAYAIAQIAGKTVQVQAKFLISASTTQQVEVRANGGGILGAIDATTITFGAGKTSSPEFVPLNLSHQTLAAGGIARGDVTWTWQYRVAGGAWNNMATTNHRIYVVLDIPNGPWSQSVSVLDTQRPWTDVLDQSCKWAAGATTADAAAAAVTSYVFSSLLLTYDIAGGETKYEDNDATGDWFFYCSDFIDYLAGGVGRGKIVNCTDCATIVTVFVNALGCNNFASRMKQSLYGGGFDCNKIIPIGQPTWMWPFASDPGPGHFAYHEVSWTVGGSYFDPLYDACLQLDTGTNPWDWTSPSVTHTPGLALKMPFSSPPAPPTLPLAVPFTAQTYRERLATNTNAGIACCLPIGVRPKSQGGRPKVV